MRVVIDPRACGRLRQVLFRVVKIFTPVPSTPHISPVRAYGQVCCSDFEGTQILLLSHIEDLMPFFSSQKSSWKDDYLLGQQSDDEDSDVFEKSGGSPPKSRSSTRRFLLICTIFATCYSILITAALIHHTVRSKYAGPNIIYSTCCIHFQTMPG